MDLSNNISGIIQPVVDNPQNYMTKVKNEPTGAMFESFYTASMDMFNEVNDAQIEGNKQQMDYLTGKTDNILGVIMAQERALSSLNFTVQVTNKMVEVYKQIMQMQI